MYKLTNVELLGDKFTVTDEKGVFLGTTQVTTAGEVMEALDGLYDYTKESMSEYIERCLEFVTGHEGIDPNKVLWLAVYEEELVLADLIDFPLRMGMIVLFLSILKMTNT